MVLFQKDDTGRIGPRAHLFLAILVLGCSLSGCQTTSQPALAEIEQVTPATVEPEDIIRVTGRGFVEGEVLVWLEGEFRPDTIGAPERRRIRLDGTATSETEIEVLISPGVMKHIVNEPARFSGKLEVDFQAPHSAVRVFATSNDVTIDFRPGGGGIPLTAKRNREAARFLRTLGIKLQNTQEEDELVVAEVIPNSPAEQAGLSFGDRLLAVDGVALSSVMDLAGVDEGKGHRFSVVSRVGSMREVLLSGVTGPTIDSDELTAMILASIAFGLFLALVAPTRRRQNTRISIPKDPLLCAVGFGLVSFFITVIPAAAVMAPNHFVLLGILVGANAVGLFIRALLNRTRRGWLTSMAHATLIPMLFLVSASLSSAIGLREIVASQAVSLHGPHAFANPFVLIVLFSALAMLWPPGATNSRLQSLLDFARWAAAVPAAAVVSATLLGGWLIPFSSKNHTLEGGWWLAAGCLIFLAKTWTVLFAARYFMCLGQLERRSSRLVSNIWILLPLAVIGTVGAVLFDSFTLPRSAGVIGQLLATGLFFTFSTMLLVLSAKAAIPQQRKRSVRYGHPLEPPPTLSET